MPRWLKKTFQAISQVVEPEPVPYDIRCYCGEMYEGVRSSQSQIIQCQQCGERLFIFPTNVYPESKQRSTRQQNSSKTNAVPSTKKDKQKQKASTQTLEATQQIAEQETDSLKEVTSSDQPDDTILVKRKRFIRPFYVIVGCMGLVLLLTAGWLIRSYRQDNAVETLRTAVEAGEAALENNNLILAEEEFAKAANAARILKQHNAHSHYVQQMHKELDVVNHLSHRSLSELITDLESKHNAANPEVWTSYFQNNYADRWVIVEAEIVHESGIPLSLLLDQQQKRREKNNKSKKKPAEKKEQPSEEEETDQKPSSQRYVVHYPVEVQGTPLVLSVTLPLLEKLPFEDSTQKVLFAAKLHRCELLNGPEPVWVINFVPQSPFLWSHYKLLSAVGYPNVDPEDNKQIQSLLRNQTLLLEKNQ